MLIAPFLPVGFGSAASAAAGVVVVGVGACVGAVGVVGVICSLPIAGMPYPVADAGGAVTGCVAFMSYGCAEEVGY